ncbi:MAG: sialidase family protein [Bacillota bacterium]
MARLKSADEKRALLDRVEVSERFTIWVDGERYYHGPAAVVAPNGDWLVSFQDSVEHHGEGSVISQVRSSDQGKTWTMDGVAYSELNDGVTVRNPAYGVTPHGEVCMVVQRRDPKQGITWEKLAGSYYLASADSGKTYRCRGFVDPEKPQRHLGTSSAIITCDDTMYMVAYSLDGCVLYTSTDRSRSWSYRGVVFPAGAMPVQDPCYPSIIQRSNGELIVQCTNGEIISGYNFQRVSADGGATWSEVRFLGDLRVTHNPDLDRVGDLMICHGRQYLGPKGAAIVAYLSDDEGESWSGPLVLDTYGGGPLAGAKEWSHGGYSASLRADENRLLVVYSTNVYHATKPDICGVWLSLKG